MSAIYCCISNIDYKYQSKRNQISLLAIGCTSSVIKRGDSSQIKKEKLEKFFGPVKEQLKETKRNPIEIKSRNGKIYKVDLEVGAFNGDNLAINKILGLPESFARTSSCPWCTVRFTYFDTQPEPRIPEDLEHILRDIPYSGRIFVPDLFHDLHEGKWQFKLKSLIDNFSFLKSLKWYWSHIFRNDPPADELHFK